MTLTISTEYVPLVTDDDGVIRMGGSRVTLETVIGTFRDGATAEEIVQKYPTLALADVYAVITYYLRHQNDVDAYLIEQARIGQEVRQQNEARFDPNGIRARLQARRLQAGA